MLISGNWVLGDDNVVRPVIKCAALAADGTWKPTEFLVDSGADRTVFMAPFLTELALQHLPAPNQLGGVGGAVTTVAVGTQIRFEVVGGGTILFQGNFAGFTQPDALDMNVLGRDIMNLFAVVVDRHGDVVCMIGKGHQYTIGVQP
jgi:hypothetical protein